MFGIGFQEMVLIFAIALLILGPQGMPELAKKLGKFIGGFTKAVDEAKSKIMAEINAPEQEKSAHDKSEILGSFDKNAAVVYPPENEKEAGKEKDGKSE